jgi:hypothetical protein
MVGCQACPKVLPVPLPVTTRALAPALPCKAASACCSRLVDVGAVAQPASNRALKTPVVALRVVDRV